MRRREGPTLIEALVGFSLAVMFLGLFWVLAVSDRPEDYRYDPWTDTATWTDKEGRTMMKSPDGSVREVSAK